MADEKGKGKSPEEEISQYLDILKKDPTSRVFARLAEAYRKAGQIDYAVSVSRDGLKNHPGYTAGQVVLARSLFDGGKSAEARGEIAQVVAAAPDNLTAQKLLAQIEVRLNDHGAAAKAYRMVQLLDPSDEEARKYLAEIGGGVPEKPPSLPAYELPPIEAAPPPAEAAPPTVEAPVAEASAPAGEGGLPPGLSFEDEPRPAAEEPVAEAEPPPQVEAAAPVSAEPVFDLDELESGPAVEEEPPPESPGDDSPFEVFTKEPRYATPPSATVEEKTEPFPEIEIPGEDDLDVEPVMEEAPVVEAEELTELVIDDVEPVMEETVVAEEEMPADVMEEMAELVIDDVEPIMEEPAGVAEEMPADVTEEITEPIVDDVEPILTEPLPEVEEPPAEVEEFLPEAEVLPPEVHEPIAEAEEIEGPAVDDVAPAMEEPPPAVAEAAAPAEPDDEFAAFGVGEAEDRRAGGEPSPEGVFNTETLANLYVTQGFYGKAADVYRQMLIDLPDDANLRQKLEEVLALEKMQAPSVHEDPVPVAVESPPEARGGTEIPVIEELQRLLTKLKERPR